MANESDAAVITASLADPGRFGAIFDRHATIVFRYLVRRVGVDEGGLVLAPRIEDEPRARLDDDGEIELFEQRTRRAQLRVGRVIRGEMIRVGREGDGAVAQLRDDVQRIVEPVMREAVGVVAESEGALGHQPVAGLPAVQRSSASYCL